MRIFTLVLRLVSATLLLSFAPLSAAVIGFDDLNASAGDIVLDAFDSYQGFIWKNISVYTSTPGFPGFNNGVISSPNAAYTAGFSSSSVIASTDPFDFISAYLGAGWYDGLSVTVTGFFNGSQRFSQTVTVNTTGAQLFTFNFTSINQVDFTSASVSSTTDPYGCGSSGCSQITLDDLTLLPSTPPIDTPEPATVAIVGFGGVALLAILRRGSFRG